VLPKDDERNGKTEADDQQRQLQFRRTALGGAGAGEIVVHAHGQVFEQDRADRGPEVVARLDARVASTRAP